MTVVSGKENSWTLIFAEVGSQVLCWLRKHVRKLGKNNDLRGRITPEQWKRKPIRQEWQGSQVVLRFKVSLELQISHGMNQQRCNFSSSTWKTRSSNRKNRWLFDSELWLGRMDKQKFKGISRLRVLVRVSIKRLPMESRKCREENEGGGG